MAIPAKTKFVQDAKPAPRAGLTLFCAKDSLACLWTRLVLAEKDVDGARIEWTSAAKPHPDLLLLNSSASLPTLADRDSVMYPASIIAEYLDERYPHPKLMPVDPTTRARLRMSIARLERELFPLAQSILTGKGEHKTARKQLAELLVDLGPLFPRSGWFLSAEYNLADCAWAALFRHINSLGLKLPPETQHQIVKYAERLFARPAFRKTP